MTSIPTVCVSLLALAAALPAQSGKPTKEEERRRKAEEKSTAKDPVVAALDKFIQKKVSKKREDWRTTLPAPPAQRFAADRDWFWHLETTAGSLKIRYLADAAPVHVTSGIYLARLGYYDGLVFHRIIREFMAQGGCPHGNGNGGPGYFMAGEFAGKLAHDRPGLLSMANTGEPRSEGSQFFLTFVPTPHLDGKHTIWGEVVEGQETLKALEALGSSSGEVKTPPKILRTWVTVAPRKVADPPGEDDAKQGGAEKRNGK